MRFAVVRPSPVRYIGSPSFWCMSGSIFDNIL